ncbi:retrovirus-related pol polyprotein from transposon 17.6, partial [Tanacetum coccineum]
MDVGSVNIPYLLARYLRLFTSGRKHGAMISEGQFFACLAEHFGLLTEERLYGLTVIVRDLPMIDMAKLVRLQICEELDDTWARLAPGLERQQVVAAGALEVVEGALDVDEGDQVVSAPVQAPQPPTAGPTRTMAQ